MRTILAAAVAILVAASYVPSARADDVEELQRQRERVGRHLLRVQQERFEAKARGEDEKTIRRLDREFRRTQRRRTDAIEELKRAQQ